MELDKREARVVTYITEYQCDFCDDGKMIRVPNNVTLRHKCNKCGRLADLTRSYPVIEQEYR